MHCIVIKYIPEAMDIVLNKFWKAAFHPSQVQPLVLADQLKQKVKSAPRDLVWYFCYNARNAVKRTATTSPAVLINKIYKPFDKVRHVETAVTRIARIPLADCVWEKLQITPEEWFYYIKTSVGRCAQSDLNVTPVEMIKRYGYPIEVYEDIETEDGYLLEMYRIPHGKIDNFQKVKPVVFLMHGLLCSSADYVLTGPERALALLLADLGYDVWIGNSRGTHHTREHVKLNPDVDNDYWKFSFHEIGVYDLPAMINLILNVTKCETLSYVGTSQGATAFFVLASEKPEYNKLINVMVSLAPAAFVSNISSPLVKLGIQLHGFLLPLAVKMGLVEFPPKQLQGAISYLNKMSHKEGVLQEALIHLLFMSCGYSYDQLNRDDLPKILSNMPHPASIYQLYHFAQNAVSGTFRRFDYGREENLQRYGEEEPPAYDLRRVTVPVALFYSSGDYLSQPKDVLRLHSELPNCTCLHKIQNENFNHLDFVYGSDVVDLLYCYVFEILQKYNV